MNDKKIKLLIVEDDEIMRETYVEVFKKEGFEVIEAIDGIEGLDKATKNIPDIIFTGIIMPRMDGFALKDALAKNVATTNIPVIMSSHMGREEDRIKAGQLGIKEFIVQGMISPIEVVEKVKAMFGSGKYVIKFSPNEMDAGKLAQDFRFSPKFECKNCYKSLTLLLKPSNIEKGEFSAKFICPNCG